MDNREDWARWLQAAGIDDAQVTHGPVMNRASMVIDAAINGQGIALARTTLAAWDLINGRLVRPFPETLRLAKTYWIICPKATAKLPKITAFTEWLLAEAAEDARQLQKLKSAVETPTTPTDLTLRNSGFSRVIRFSRTGERKDALPPAGATHIRLS